MKKIVILTLWQFDEFESAFRSAVVGSKVPRVIKWSDGDKENPLSWP